MVTMDGSSLETNTSFEQHRSHLLRVAYGVLGTISEAEDVVQEAWLRWSSAASSDIRDSRAWLTTVTTRLAIDALRAARIRRNDYVGTWLPEPLIESYDSTAEHALETAERVSLALLLALERLTPEERAAWLLRETFEWDYPQIAHMLDRKEPACRQLVKRARERIHDGPRRFEADADEHARLVEAFARAAERGDSEALAALLSDDVTLISDGGGKVAALRRPISGHAAVVRALSGLARVQVHPSHFEVCRINGRMGILLRSAPGAPTSIGFQVRAGQIRAIYLQRNPDKIRLPSRDGTPTAP